MGRVYDLHAPSFEPTSASALVLTDAQLLKHSTLFALWPGPPTELMDRVLPPVTAWTSDTCAQVRLRNLSMTVNTQVYNAFVARSTSRSEAWLYIQQAFADVELQPSLSNVLGCIRFGWDSNLQRLRTIMLDALAPIDFPTCSSSSAELFASVLLHQMQNV